MWCLWVRIIIVWRKCGGGVAVGRTKYVYKNATPVDKIVSEIKEELFPTSAITILRQLASVAFTLTYTEQMTKDMETKIRQFYSNLFDKKTLEATVQIKTKRDTLNKIILEGKDIYELAKLMSTYISGLNNDDPVLQAVKSKLEKVPEFGIATLDEQLGMVRVKNAWGVLRSTRIDAHAFGGEYLAEAIKLMFLDVSDNEETEEVEYARPYSVKKIKDRFQEDFSEGVIASVGKTMQIGGKNIIEQIAEKLKNEATAQKLKQDLDQVVKDWDKERQDRQSSQGEVSETTPASSGGASSSSAANGSATAAAASGGLGDQAAASPTPSPGTRTSAPVSQSAARVTERSLGTYTSQGQEDREPSSSAPAMPGLDDAKIDLLMNNRQILQQFLALIKATDSSQINQELRTLIIIILQAYEVTKTGETAAGGGLSAVKALRSRSRAAS